MDHEEILVPNEGLVMVVNLGHDRVSYLNLWSSVVSSSLPVATSRTPSWQSELKWNSVISSS